MLKQMRSGRANETCALRNETHTRFANQGVSVGSEMETYWVRALKRCLPSYRRRLWTKPSAAHAERRFRRAEQLCGVGRTEIRVPEAEGPLL